MTMNPNHRAARESWEIGAVIMTLTYLAAAAQHAFGFPAWALPLIAGATGIAAAVTALTAFESLPLGAYVAAWAALLAWWLHDAAESGPWHIRVAVGLLIPGLILVGIGSNVFAGLIKRADRADADDAEWHAGREAARYARLLERRGFEGIKVLTVERTRSGVTVRLQLPDDGHVTIANLQNDSLNIDTALNMPRGTTRFSDGRTARQVDWLITKPMSDAPVPFPVGELYPTTVNDPFEVGVDESGDPVWVLYRELCLLVVGTRGMGKTTFANVFLAQTLRCADVLVFGLDVAKGGRLFRPWLQPWLDGRAPHPAIDWIATDRDEAELMLRATLRGITGRANAGTGSKVTPSTRTPAIILLVDELASIVGDIGTGPRYSSDGTTNRQLADLLSQIVFTGRSECIDAVLLALRGTVTMTGGGDLKSQCLARIGFGCKTQTDASYIIEDDTVAQKLIAGNAGKPGNAIVEWPGVRAQMMKGYDLEDPAMIDEIAEAVSQYRPAPDVDLELALGQDYAERWDREHWQTILRRWQNGGSVHGTNGVSMSKGGGRVTTLDERFRTVLDEQDLNDDGNVMHPARLAMRDHLMRRRAAGDTPKMILKELDRRGLAVHRATLHDWLAQDRDAGFVHQVGDGRWVWIQQDPPALEAS